MHGYDFHWRPFADRPDVTLPNGSVLENVEVDENFVPIIRSAVRRAVHNAERAIPVMPVGQLDDEPLFGQETDLISEIGKLDDAQSAEMVPGLTRIVDDVRNEYDDAALSDEKQLKIVTLDEEQELELDLSGSSKVDIRHLAHHLPKMPKGCPTCSLGKWFKTHSRRRAL